MSIRGTSLALAPALLASLASHVTGGTIALDARSFSTVSGANPAADPRFTTFRDVLRGPGHTLQSQTGFTAADLDGVDLLVLFSPAVVASTFTAQEIADVKAFVAAGHHLFFVADAGLDTTQTLPQVNDIVQTYGVTVQSGVLNAGGLAVFGWKPHPATDGVHAVGFDYHRSLKLSAAAFDLTAGSPDVCAVVPPQAGEGRVAVIADATCFNDPGFGGDHDITDFDTRRLLENLVDWFLPPPEGGCPGAGGFVPALSASSLTPTAGGAFSVQVTQGLGGAPATFFFGLGAASIPMAGGCTLNVAPLLPATFTVPLNGVGPGQGTIVLPGVLPAGTSGATFAMQSFVTDPNVPHGFSNSNEIVVQIQ